MNFQKVDDFKQQYTIMGYPIQSEETEKKAFFLEKMMELRRREKEVMETPYRELYCKLYGMNANDKLKNEYKNTEFKVIYDDENIKYVGKIISADFYNCYPYTQFLFVFENGQVFTDEEQPKIVMII